MSEVNSIYTRYYPSKILLFGEHIVVLGGNALAIPYPKYSGRLVIKNAPLNSSEKASSDSLRKFAKYLSKIEEKFDSNFEFNLTLMLKELDEGLYFESAIIQGFGLGSSGALVAAVFDRYFDYKTADSTTPDNKTLRELKECFALMESSFHGKSSGTDPLICYVNKPILLKSGGRVEVVKVPDFEEDRANSTVSLFLLNTHIKRETGPLVLYFLERCKEAAFKQLCQEQLAVFNNNCIEGLLNGDGNKLWQNMKKLSRFQLIHVPKMLPDYLLPNWEKGLKNDLFYLKMCGAGGGGFMLGVTKKPESLTSYFSEADISIIGSL